VPSNNVDVKAPSFSLQRAAATALVLLIGDA
jgi:hypothetical protein